MKEKNGFALFETLVVSTFILGTLIFLYIQFSSIKRNYSTSFTYNTVPGLYHAKTLVSFLEEDGYTYYDYELNKTSNGDKGYIKINDCHGSERTLCSSLTKSVDAKNILFVGNNISILQSNLSTSNYDTSTFSGEFRKFILSLETTEKGGYNRIIVEFNNHTFACINIGVSKDNKGMVEYTVNHYLMNTSGTGYDLVDSEIFSNLNQSTVTPDIKSYTGFTSPSVQTIKLEKDSNNVVNYYYTRNQYTVTLNKGTGIDSVSGAGTYYYGANVTVGATAASGYKFKSWTGTYTTSSFTMPASNVTMTANASINSYTVTFNANGGSVTPSSATVTYGGTYTTLPTPSRPSSSYTGIALGTSLQTGASGTIYYTFLGWFTAASGGTQVTTSTKVTTAANHTIYAHWAASSPSGQAYYGTSSNVTAYNSATITVYTYGYKYITITCEGTGCGSPYINEVAKSWNTKYSVAGTSSVNIRATGTTTNTRLMRWTLSN
jgi:uncharacterized repeat protein (TIGR02543 family)